jgi:hypothetical protein
MNTSSAATRPGAILFQFNPGAIPGSQPATATVLNLTASGAALAANTQPIELDNSKILNEVAVPVSPGISVFSFDLTITGSAVAQPSLGHFGSAFAVQLLAADSKTPLLSSDPSGAIFIAELNPNGSATARSLTTSASVRLAPALAQNVADATLSASANSLHATARQLVSGTVAIFTDTNPASTVGDFSATIDWGDHTTSSGSIQSAGVGTFTVVGTHDYAQPGPYRIEVRVVDYGGSQARADATVSVSSPTSGAGSHSASGSGTTGIPSDDGPRLLVVARFGVHMQRTRLVLAFSAPLDPNSARDPKNYRIVAPEPDRWLGKRHEQVVGIDAASYDPTTYTVTLLPHRRLDIHHPFHLTIRGATPNGVRGAFGRLFEGAGPGRSGTDETIVVTRKNLVLERIGVSRRFHHASVRLSGHDFRLLKSSGGSQSNSPERGSAAIPTERERREHRAGLVRRGRGAGAIPPHLDAKLMETKTATHLRDVRALVLSATGHRWK